MENKEIEEIEEIIQLLKNPDTANLGKELLIKKGIRFWSFFNVNENWMGYQHLEVHRDKGNKFLTEFILNENIDIYKYDGFYSIYVMKE